MSVIIFCLFDSLAAYPDFLSTKAGIMTIRI
jgi:hypothetical protein